MNRKPTIALGTIVTNSKGWHGEIVKIDSDESCINCEFGRYYWIRWKERETSSEKIIATRPILGHLRSQFDVVQINSGES